MDKDAVLPNLQSTDNLARAIAERFAEDRIDVTVGPAMGGAFIARDVAHELMCLGVHKVAAVYAEKGGSRNEFVIRPTYRKFITGKRVLVTEDNLTTGGSVRQVIGLVRALGGEVVGVAAFINRGGVTTEDVGNVPKLATLLTLELNSWSGEECKRTGPCSRGVPIRTDLGKGC